VTGEAATSTYTHERIRAANVEFRERRRRPRQGFMIKRSVLLAVLSALTLSAADITGTWKASAKAPSGGGTIKRSFFFKQDGTKLTGKTSSDRWPTSAIENGKIEGDTLSFTLTVDVEFGKVKVSFTGRVQGDVINMTAMTAGNPFDFVATRATR